MEERIKKLEMLVQRLIVKSTKKTVSAMITPYPISNCVAGEDVHGTILKYMFSARGVISKGRIQFDKKLKSGVEIVMRIENDIGGSSKSYTVARNIMLVKPNIEVFSGDRLTISVNPIDREEKLNEVWIAFVWIPYIGEATVKSFLIDKVLEEIEALKEIEDKE